MELAARRNLPASIHCLQAWGRLHDLLRTSARPARGFLLHWMDLTTTIGQGEYDCTHYLGEYATALVMLAAWAEGVHSCPASMHRSDDAAKVLGLLAIALAMPAMALLVEANANRMDPVRVHHSAILIDGHNDIPQALLDGIHRALAAGETNYPPSDGVLELRLAVQRFYAERLGLDYPIESIVIASGVRPAISALIACDCPVSSAPSLFPGALPGAWPLEDFA